MGMSFDDKESFMEAAGSLRFNNPQSHPNTHPSQRVGTEDIGFNNRSNVHFSEWEVVART